MFLDFSMSLIVNEVEFSNSPGISIRLTCADNIRSISNNFSLSGKYIISIKDELSEELSTIRKAEAPSKELLITNSTGELVIPKNILSNIDLPSRL